MTHIDGYSTAGMPDFVVIGAQKSASTFLQDQLDQHPAIEIAEGEIRCFQDPYYSQEAVNSLPQVFTRQDEGVVRGIKRPSYLGRPEVAERLHLHLPQARLFVVLREPVSRAISSYYHYVRQGFLPLMSIDEAFEALLSGELETRYPRSVEVLTYGLYGQHLQRYLRYFPRDQLMIFEQKQMTGDVIGSLRRAFTFLGVDPSFVPSKTSVSNRGVYSRRRLQLLRSKNRFMYHYTPGLEYRSARRPTPGGWLWNASVVAFDRILLSRLDDGRPPEMSELVRTKVSQYYETDRALLKQLLADESVEAVWL